MEYIPTSEERKSLEIYLENNSFTHLCECEKFMTIIARVENPRKKIEAMLFKMDFMPLMSELSNGKLEPVVIFLDYHSRLTLPFLLRYCLPNSGMQRNPHFC